MSLNITDSIKRLGTRLGVDMSKAPASNIADSIDYISDGVGAHTGVIADAIDKLEIKGGGGGEVSGKPVRFYAVDELVYSYTKDEFLALNAMPANPQKEGLTPQGWNWSFESAKDYVQKYGELDVGQVYITDDGKTRYYIEIPDFTPENRLTVSVRCVCSVQEGVTIEWGDGGTTIVDSEESEYQHTYANTGSYIIAFNVTSGTLTLRSNMSSAFNFLKPEAFLKKICVGDHVQTIDEYAFAALETLEYITIPVGIENISTAHLFYSCKSLKYVTLPSGISIIDKYAFLSNDSLKKVIMPDGLRAIGAGAFSNCMSLETISFPESLTSIGKQAFNSCPNITHLTFPSSMNSVGDNAFANCLKLKKVEFTNGVNIGGYCFSYCQNLENVVLHSSSEGGKSIGNYSFQQCVHLTSVVIPNGVQTIGDSAFSNCYLLKDVTLSDTVQGIGYNAFPSCTSLQSIVVPHSVSGTLSQTFIDCHNLLTADISENVNALTATFDSCSLLGAVHIRSTTPPSLDAYTFRSTSQDIIIYVPYSADHSILNAYKTATGWSNYADNIQEEPQ